MAKQATGMFDYVSPSGRTFFNKGRQYTSPTPGRTGATIDLSPLKGKTAAGGAPLASRQIPAAIQEAGPEAMSITDNIAATQPQMVTETQQPIENRGIDPRYMIQGGGPRIDLSGFFPERANKNYDPSKAIGGENVPYQASGFFRGLMGDPANRKNIEAQLAQGAEWKQDARDQKIEERLLNRMREGDKPTQARFEATQLSNKESEANRVAAENKRIEAENKRIALEGERLGLTKQQIQDAKDAHTADLQLQRQQMLDRVTQNQAENDLQSNALAQRLSIANYPQTVHDPKGNVLFYNPQTGRPTGTYKQPNFGMVTDPNDPKKQILGTTAGGYEGIGPSGSVNEPQVTGFGDSYVNGLDASGNKFGKLPPPPKPAAAVTPARSAATGELGEETRGLIPSVGDYLSSAESPISLSQDAPTTAQNRAGFMAGLGDLGRGVSEGARSIKPLMLGGRLPRYTPEQGGGVLGMMLNAPGAAMTPVEAGVNSVLRNTKNSYNSMFGDDSGASMAVPNKLQDPSGMYMSDKEYKNYLRSKRLTE